MLLAGQMGSCRRMSHAESLLFLTYTGSRIRYKEDEIKRKREGSIISIHSQHRETVQRAIY